MQQRVNQTSFNTDSVRHCFEATVTYGQLCKAASSAQSMLLGGVRTSSVQQQVAVADSDRNARRQTILFMLSVMFRVAESISHNVWVIVCFSILCTTARHHSQRHMCTGATIRAQLETHHRAIKTAPSDLDDLDDALESIRVCKSYTTTQQ